jgi:cold-inducible RNA-binding protein
MAARLRAAACRPETEPRAQPGVSDSMGRRLYVGNLPYSATEEQLTELFGQAGKVDNVRVMRDMATGRARGFAFVEMATDEDAQKAISQFHEQQMEGRALVVNEARPKPEGGFGGGGGGGRSRGGGGGYDRGGGGGGYGGGGGGGKREPRW